MGAYDVPTFIDKVLEVTGKNKVNLVGYSQGTAQIFYGMAKNQDYFAERVSRFVALAPCIWTDLLPLTWEEQVSKYLMYDKLGMYSFDGGDGSDATDEICTYINDADCDLLLIPGNGSTLGSMMYFG